MADSTVYSPGWEPKSSGTTTGKLTEVTGTPSSPDGSPAWQPSLNQGEGVIPTRTWEDDIPYTMPAKP